MDTSIKELYEQLENAGINSTVVSVHHLSDLQSDLEKYLDQGILDREFYDEITDRYDLQWHFHPPADFPTAQSIILVAAPQPKVSVKFKLSGKTYSAIIPPTYFHDTDDESANIITHHLSRLGYKSCQAILPEKLLAVRSGFARYGKNNVAYINGLGSYFRLRAYFSDIPSGSDNWQENKMMERCSQCDACMKKCPTGAIRKEIFLIQGEKCLTFFNEKSDEFPEWIDPSWHNCLIGCMICQDVCPVNKDFTNRIVEGGEFHEEETRMILEGVPIEDLPSATIEKLKKLYLFDDYNLLQRNLKVLINLNFLSMAKPQIPNHTRSKDK